MKTKDLIELLERNGWKFKRHGANHDYRPSHGARPCAGYSGAMQALHPLSQASPDLLIYIKGNERESIVRHKETDEELAKAIIKRRGLK